MIVGIRISQLRAKHNLTQKELSQKLNEISGGACKTTYVTLSTYEQGTRLPPLSTAYWLSVLFNVSLDYLCGRDEEQTKKDMELQFALTESNASTESPIPEYGVRIHKADYVRYDGCPVYVKFTDYSHQDGWALLNYENKYIVFSNVIYPIGSNIELYEHIPNSSRGANSAGLKPLNLTSLYNADCVWVEMAGKVDSFIAGSYNGYYKPNEDRTALFKVTGDRMLPYEGCGTLFNAYIIKN